MSTPSVLPPRIRALALLALSALFSILAAFAPAARACPVGVPAGLAASTVGPAMTVDGQALAVLQVRGRAPSAVVLGQVEQAWRAAGYDVRRADAAGWNVVSALGGSCLTTLQLAQRGGAFGYLAVNRLARGSGPAMARLPLPPGATVLTTVSSVDDGRKGTIAAFTARQPLEQLHAYYLKRLNDDKWSAVGSQVSLDRDHAAIGAVVSARRGRERIDVVLWRDGATHAVIDLADAL